MGSDVEDAPRCPRCGGPFGEATTVGGSFSVPCLACGYVQMAPICYFPRAESLAYRVTIRWPGASPTPREAALLRQFLPGLANLPIPEVRRRFEGMPEWTSDDLNKDDMRRLRAAAEARGFPVEVVPQGGPAPREPRPDARLSLYSVRFKPAFHEEGFLFLHFGETRDSLTLISRSHSEMVAVPMERGIEFLDEIAALDPLGIPDTPAGGIDGITLECSIAEAQGTRKFTAWSPDPWRHPRQHGFVKALLQLARERVLAPGSVAYLEQVSGYLRGGPRPGPG
ncbi:hypothetical protein HPC49_44570 [Pyxidicoccus fallax]|uniref:Uncharacterized protein n=1 Tax=Pyxidicoccus fallax TaxID=394095 RepID=A0A848LXB4_9BACT|nr:hypothetical protein [Pyxidicoccus fallax]NMO22695.1 hypothetical protein [Pyxidicoccus fallax]NPC85257.1 hypothetical protein [Pyxidicoccus fallax]